MSEIINIFYNICSTRLFFFCNQTRKKIGQYFCGLEALMQNIREICASLENSPHPHDMEVIKNCNLKVGR